jgi:hypothetical protein
MVRIKPKCWKDGDQVKCPRGTRGITVRNDGVFIEGSRIEEEYRYSYGWAVKTKNGKWWFVWESKGESWYEELPEKPKHLEHGGMPGYIFYPAVIVVAAVVYYGWQKTIGRLIPGPM